MDESSSHLRRERTLNIQFNPSEYGILNQYKEVEEIYKMRMSPTIVSIVHGANDTDQNLKIIKKIIQKRKLYG